MSQQGGRPARHEDDWWEQLYDDSTEDTGPAPAPDSLDDRYASASGAVTGRPDGDGTAPPRDPPLPPQRTTPPPPPPTPAAPPSPPVPPGSPPDPAASARASGADAYPAPPGAPASPPASPPSSPVPVPPAPPASPPGAAVPAGPSGAEAYPAPPASAPPNTPASPPSSSVPAPPAPPASPPGAAVPAGPSGAEAYPAPPASAPLAAPDTHRVPPAPGAPSPVRPPAVPSALDYVGSGPPTYDPEPTTLPAADPDALGELVADTVLDGARYGACTVRAVSLRGDSARYRGEPRRDALLTARFGAGEQALVLVAMATGVRATPGAHRAAAEACRLIGRAVGRSHQRLAEDIRAARRGDLKSGLNRLTDRSLGRLRADAAAHDLDPEEHTASLRCLLLPADPGCRTRVFFGTGDGGLFRLRDGEWQDIEPRVSPAGTTGAPVVGFGSPPAETPEGDRLTMDLGIPTPPSPYEPAPEPPREPFRFRASVARPGDVLVMATSGLADPLRGEPALCAYLARRWSGGTPPGLAAFLADAQVRVKGYADDRTAAAVWEA
ncbi:protein phosphatase 2C domain-containing protein [Streptomyces bungoensis]|uniref:protein phosphatase 2C domain-containing protein n=1 Tax=Streptomyces bungoensis TaxID=285568 RepID=UPI003406D5DD